MKCISSIVVAILGESLLLIVLRNNGIESYFQSGTFIFMSLLVGNIIYTDSKRFYRFKLAWLHESSNQLYLMLIIINFIGCTLIDTK